MRAVIIEDEPLAARYLEALLLQTNKVTVLGIAHDASWGLTLCTDRQPDAVFLDIKMPGRDGLQLAFDLARLPKPPLIVFTTGHAQCACQAFRLEAVDYLLKPLEAAQVWEAVCRLESRLTGETNPAAVAPYPCGDRLSVKSKDDDVIHLIPRLEVLAALHHDRRTWIHTERGEFATYYVLAALHDWLGDPPFLRISRDAVVNLRAVEEVEHFGDRLYQVRLRDRLGTRVQASRSGASRLAELVKPTL